MENGPEYIIHTDGIEAAARQMALAGISFAEAVDAFTKFSQEIRFVIGRLKVKRFHTRHKQIERARTMMERGQKGK